MFAELAIFPEDADIPLVDGRAAVEGDARSGMRLTPKSYAICLFRLSLLLHFDLAARTVRLHDVIRAFLERKKSSKVRRAGTVSSWRAAGVTSGVKLPQHEHYLWRALAYHLKGAGREAELHWLLFQFDWLQAKLAAAGD